MAAYYKASSADIIGNVSIGNDCGIWYHATLRGDQEPIVIGDETNVQDNAVLHPSPGFPVTVGKRVTIGHSAIVHGCTVEDDVLIGMGAIVMNGAVVHQNCIVAAGALVPPGMEVPEGTLVLGSPAKVARMLTEQDREQIKHNYLTYVDLAKSLNRIEK